MHRHHNGLKTTLLMGSMVGLMLLIGGLLSAAFKSSSFIWIMGLLSLGGVAYTYWNSDKLALRSMNAYPSPAMRCRCSMTSWRSSRAPPASRCPASTWPPR